MKAKKRPAPPRKCQMSCLKKGEHEAFSRVIYSFSPTIPVVVVQQLTVLVHVSGLCRGDVCVLLFVHKVVEGGESTDQAEHCGRNYI